MTIEPTCIVWRRTGKEHGEDSFQVNPPEVVHDSLQSKADWARSTEPKNWAWWKLNDDVLVEVPGPRKHYRESTRIYYLPKRHCVAISDMRFGVDRQRLDWEPELYWYVHIADIEWQSELDCWVFTDLFADVLASEDGLIYRVKDLHEVALATQIGLISAEKAGLILEQTQSLLDTMKGNEFPYPELQEAMALDGDLMREMQNWNARLPSR